MKKMIDLSYQPKTKSEDLPMGGLILALMPFSIAFVHMIFSAL